MTNEVIRRGDVVLVPFGYADDPAARKVRPAVVVQNDIGNRFSSNVIVVAVTSQQTVRGLPTELPLRMNERLAQGSGLVNDSVVDASVISTISKRAVRRRIGSLSRDAMRAVDRCLAASLGLPPVS